MSGPRRKDFNGQSKVSLRCLSCGHRFEVKASGVFGSYGCRLCGLDRGGLARRLDPNVLKVRCKATNRKFKSVVYEQGVCYIQFECEWGKEHTQSAGDLTSKGCGCRKHESYFEFLVRALVEHETGQAWPCVRRRQLRAFSKSDYVPWEIDLFNTHFAVGIEVDGLQHEQDVGWGPEALRRIRQRDKLKTDWCKANGFTLIRLRHTWLRALKKCSPEAQRAKIRAVLQKAAVLCRKTPGPFVLNRRNVSLEIAQLARLQDEAKALHCRLISKSWLGVDVAHRFKCSEHGGFLRTPHSFRLSRYGCPKCGHRALYKSKSATVLAGTRARFIELCGSSYEMCGAYKGTSHRVECRCVRHKQVFHALPSSSLGANYVMGCPQCTNERFRFCQTNKAEAFSKLCGAQFLMQAPYLNSKTPVRCKCVKHDLLFNAKPDRSLRHKRIVGCPLCGRERSSVAARARCARGVINYYKDFIPVSQYRRECRRLNVTCRDEHAAAYRLGRFRGVVPHTARNSYLMSDSRLFQKTRKQGPPWQYTDEHDDPADLKNHPNPNVRRLPSGKLKVVTAGKKTPANENARSARMRKGQ